MISRIVEIGNPARLSIQNQQLVVERDHAEVGCVPLEDLGILVIDNAQVSVSIPLLSACAEQNIAVVVCDARHTPAGMLSPFEGHTLHAKTLREQVEVSEPTRKRLWQTIIQAKIREQAELLKELTGKDAGLMNLIAFVRSGDPENIEARAARTYFTKLFGEDFIRERESDGINAMLNYGYAVVRAAVARAVVGAGLHPALGLHHRNQYNAFALADDLVEPLRPLVDATVFNLLTEYGPPKDLTPVYKRALLAVLTCEVSLDDKRFPVMTALGYYATNVRRCVTGEGRKLACPAR